MESRSHADFNSQSPDRPLSPVSSPTPLIFLAGVIFLGNVLARILGLARELLAAGRFGTGDTIAAFTVSDNLNTLIFDLIVNGMLHAAIVPVLAVFVVDGVVVDSDFRHVLSTLFLLSFLISGLVALAGYRFAPDLIRLMTDMFDSESARSADATELATELLRIVLPSLVFLATATVLMAGLYAMQRPAGPAVGAVVRNGAVVVAILLLSGAEGVRSMALGVLAGSILLLITQAIFLWRAGGAPIRPAPIFHPAVQQVFRLYLPVFVGLIVSSLVVVVDRNLAWGLEEDAIGAMRYSTSLVQLILGLVAAAVSLAVLPRLSRSFSEGNDPAFRDDFSRAMTLVAVLIIPAVVGMAVLSQPIVKLLFEHGATDAPAARLITIALLAYLPGHLLAGFDQVMIFTFYARKNTLLPVSVGVVSAGGYLLAARLLVDRFDMAGLVAANSIQLGLHTMIMAVLIWRFVDSSAFSGLGRSIVRIGAASIIMGIVVFGLWSLIDNVVQQSGLLAELISVAIPGLVGVVSYLALLHRIGNQAAEIAGSDLGTQLRRVLGRF